MNLLKPILDTALEANKESIKEECVTCGTMHVPTDASLAVSTKYCGPMYFCSENCWDYWVQIGRYEP